MRQVIVLISRGMGGAERRYARCFVAMSEVDPDLFLVINAGMYQRLINAGINLNECDNVEVIRNWWATSIEGPTQSNQLLPEWLVRLKRLLVPVARKIEYIRLSFCLRRIVGRRGIRLLHLVLEGLLIGLPFVFDKNVQTIISIVSPKLEDLSGSGIGYRLYLLALRRCDAVDALSPQIRKNLAALGINQEKIYVSPCSFADYHRFAPAQHKKKWIVFAGRFIDYKNPLLFIEAIPKILAIDPSVRFFVLGAGPQQREIVTQIQRLGLDSLVSVRFMPDISDILSSSIIFASVQSYENYPSQSLLEAMACENAIIATDVGETRRLVDESVGILIAPSSEEFADAAIYLLQNPNLLKRMGRHARRKVIKEHNIETFVRYLSAVYQEIAESTGEMSK